MPLKDHRTTFVLIENKLNKRSLLIGTNIADGEIAWRQHSGGHTTGPNWPYFIEFAERYFE